MTGDLEVRQLVVMGVSGVGKTTVAKELSARVGWTFTEGDEFHSEAAVATMAAGRPLTDEDRWPWLRRIGGWMSEQIAAGRPSVVTCSALRRAYRDVLADGRPEVVFCHLVGDREQVAGRLDRRTGHYMPASLLASQLAVLEPLQPDERGVTVSAEGTPDEVVARVLAKLDLEAATG